MDEKGNKKYVEVQGIKKPKVLASLHMVIATSNPDPSWIRTELLFKTKKENITYFGTDEGVMRSLKPLNLDDDDINEYACFVVPTEANAFLPDDFFELNAAGKPDW